MHLSFASPWVDPRDISGEPRGNGTVLVFLFPPQERGIKVYLSPFISFRFVIQCDRQGEKCFIWYHGRSVKMSKRRAKKLGTFFVIFANEKQITVE